MARIAIPDSQRFFNRHLSWMQFNQRVLEEARDPGNPLLERVKFLGITASNLDEFVEVRLAGLMQQAEHGNREPEADGRLPEQALAELTSKIHSFVDEQYECWRDELVPALEAESVRVLGRGEWVDAEPVFQTSDQHGKAQRIESGIEQDEIVAQWRQDLAVLTGDLFHLVRYG